MNFKDTLKLAREHKISVIDLEIAENVEQYASTNNYDFEKLCSAVKVLYLKTYDLNINKLLRAIDYLLKNEDATISNIYKLDSRTEDLITELACSLD